MSLEQTISNTPMIDQYTDDLTLAAKRNPDRYQAYARDREISKIIDYLGRLTKNNPILLGEAGVGKTAIVEGLARQIALNEAGKKLNGKHIRVMQIAALGQRDTVQKMLKIIDEFRKTKGQNILFIDEIHTIMGADQTGGAMDLGDVLKPAMARGEIQLIGSTTQDEYNKFIAKDPALQRRFQDLIVEEPDRNTAIHIVDGTKTMYEKYHQVHYTQQAIVGSVDLSTRYIADRFLPDKALDLIDQAGEIANRHGQTKIDLKDIAMVLQIMRGIPVTNILKNDSLRLRNLAERLSQDVKGQREAIKQVANAVTIAKAGLQAPNKPLCSFLFLGTTGVGKTALARALAKAMFDSEEAMVRFDMSEFSERDSLDRFQYMVTDQIKRKPYCILLFDEIEKASTGIHDRLLQVLDNGELRDSRGRRTNFRNCIIIMTTNLGAELVADKQSYKLAVDEVAQSHETPRQRDRREESFRKEVSLELTNIFRPEFVNRIEHKIVFNVLTRSIIKQITVHDLKILNHRLAIRGFRLHYEDDLVNYLADVGTDVANGARPLERVIERDVTAPLSMMLLQLESQPDNRYHTIATSVLDQRADYDRTALQRHKVNGRKVLFRQIPDSQVIDDKDGEKVS
ncbi:AAA family ATPase [uncultured Limosilactobacillus sp.]|uniref:AAA family ATPase n=1 Tax=uncultured Limosilactobacillus sp. TaxID=2837629 RepID=UPI0025EF57BD|nr:ATP-dependent Clp protease ATP-binding subunit [uncultured Limosilactobacillus sp.]